MRKTVLVTGVNGFVGHHVVRELISRNITVVGLGHDKTPTEQNASTPIRYIQCDLTDVASVQRLDLQGLDAVIHLAGLANVGLSFAQPAQFLAANTSMSINLLQHALDSDSKARFIVISSGAVYESEQSLPITETGKLTHGSPYAVSKLAVEMMNDYYRSRGLEVITMRPFNHIGPRQSSGFIVPDLLTKLRAGKDTNKPIIVGNLDTARDYTDVRDVARAYVTIALHDTPPQSTIYNVCSGKSTTGRKMLHILAKAIGYTNDPEVHVDKKLLRPNDALDIYGDNSRLRDEFNWQPVIEFEQTVHDIVGLID
jgi:GDP-4-dehydro-6-deoxy-D-mannose reductase